MQRIVILGRGGAGKSTFARRLGAITDVPVIELDERFWQPNAGAMSRDRWIDLQVELASSERWIMDGDLGFYDAPEVRIERAEVIIILNFSFLRCGWRSVRRSRERLDYWRWLLGYRRRSLPALMTTIAQHASRTPTYRFRTPREAASFLNRIAAARME